MTVYVITGVSKAMGVSLIYIYSSTCIRVSYLNPTIWFEFLRQIAEDQKNQADLVPTSTSSTQTSPNTPTSLKQAATDTAGIVGERGIDWPG